MLSQLNQTTAEHIRSAIAKKRFRFYAAVFGGDVVRAANLYALDVELKGAFLELLHFVELPMRDAFHSALVAQYGHHWYLGKTVALDDRTLDRFIEARDRLPLRHQADHDRVIAEASFGAWADLLEVGGASRSPMAIRGRADYELTLWPAALKGTFLGLTSDRQDAAARVRRVRRLRNRVAHHESVVFGIHQTGEKDAAGRLRRRTPQNALADVRELINHFSAPLSGWADSCDHVDQLLKDSLAGDALAHAMKTRTGIAWT